MNICNAKKRVNGYCEGTDKIHLRKELHQFINYLYHQKGDVLITKKAQWEYNKYRELYDYYEVV